MSLLDDQAIAAALTGRWQDAIIFNQKILDQETSNIDALNRLAYALAKCGQFKAACEKYHKVLSLDSYNPLALKNLDKYKNLQEKKVNSPTNGNGVSISPSLFLSNGEHTKTVTLIDNASYSTLQTLAVGEEVFALPKRFELQIKDKHNTYVGKLPDDVSHPLLKLMKQKNICCRFFVKDITADKLIIFLKY